MKARSFYHQTHLLIFLHFRPEMSTQLFRKSHMLQLRYLLVPIGPGNETPLKISQNGVAFPLSPQCFTFFVPRVLLPNGKKQTSATIFSTRIQQKTVMETSAKQNIFLSRPSQLTRVEHVQNHCTFMRFSL